MNNVRSISCFVVLMFASLACGQSPVAQPAGSNPPIDAPIMPARAFDLPRAPWELTADANFLLWFIPQERTAGIANLPGPAFFGIGGDLANGENSESPLPGARFALGFWSPDFDDPMLGGVHAYRRGAEVAGFFMIERSAVFGGRVSVAGLGTSDLVGRATADLWGLEANAFTNVRGQPVGQIFRADVFAGFRYLHFNSTLAETRRTTYDADLTNFPAFRPLAGTQVEQTAVFSTATQFFGGQVGLGTQLIVSPDLILGGEFKLALGSNLRDSEINGQIVSTPPNPALGTGPFPASSGSYSRSTFAYVPQLGLYGAFRIGERMTFRVGFDLLYWSDVARAADQVDLSTSGGSQGRAEVVRSRGVLFTGLDLGLRFYY